MVEGKIHSTGPFIFFTGNVNSDNSQGSELPKQQFQLIIQNLQLKKPKINYDSCFNTIKA